MLRRQQNVVFEELQERYQAFLPSSLVTSDELASIYKEDAFSVILMPDDIPQNQEEFKEMGIVCSTLGPFVW